MLIRWAIQRGTSVIPKATSESHLKVSIAHKRCALQPANLYVYMAICRLRSMPGSHACCVVPVQSNFEALDFELTEEDMRKLSSLEFQKRLVDGSMVRPPSTAEPEHLYLVLRLSGSRLHEGLLALVSNMLSGIRTLDSTAWRCMLCCAWCLFRLLQAQLS